MTKYLPLLLSGLVLLLCSCNGQATTKAPKSELPEVGSFVTALDPTALVLYQDSMDRYWFSSKDKGLYVYDGESLLLYTSEDGLCSYNILSVQEDLHGLLFFDTTDGVCTFDGKTFSTLTVTENKEAQPTWQAGQGDLWFRMGWDHNGPFRYDGKELVQLEFPKNPMEQEFYEAYPTAPYNPYGIYSIFKDSKGNVWFGTSNLGIYMYDGKDIRWMYESHLTNTPEGGSFGIRSIAEDTNGNYWICNATYSYILMPTEQNDNDLKAINYKRQPGISNLPDGSLYFLTIVPGNAGDIWMQTYDRGLWHAIGNVLTPFLIQDGNKEIMPTSIFKDKQGVMWMGTQNDGIYNYNGETLEAFRLN